MKKKTPEQELMINRANIINELADWNYINVHGCNDPFWPDGSNMNLVRNHIIYYKKEIERICAENQFAFPEEYYLPLPPEVDERYMANLKQRERVKRLRDMGDVLTTRKKKYDRGQLRIFDF